jgi:DNA-binding MarR family transcriptional regulator
MNPPRAARLDGPADARTTRGGLDQSRLTHLVGYAASRASVELKKTFQQHLGPLDLKAVEFSILVLVASNPQVNQKQLGESLDVSAPNMAITLDRMVDKGWVERVRSTADRRAQLIHLTSKGRRLVERAEGVAATMEHEAVAMLSRAERLLLIELLLKVARGKTPKEHLFKAISDVVSTN